MTKAADKRWRVVEASSVILLLLDSRCPILHCPPSLRSYLQSLRPHKEVVLVLTKADLVDPSALAQWKEFIKGWWGQPVEVASVTSYDLDYLNGEWTLRHRRSCSLMKTPVAIDQTFQCSRWKSSWELFETLINGYFNHLSRFARALRSC